MSWGCVVWCGRALSDLVREVWRAVAEARDAAVHGYPLIMSKHGDLQYACACLPACVPGCPISSSASLSAPAPSSTRRRSQWVPDRLRLSDWAADTPAAAGQRTLLGKRLSGRTRRPPPPPPPPKPPRQVPPPRRQLETAQGQLLCRSRGRRVPRLRRLRPRPVVRRGCDPSGG